MSLLATVGLFLSADAATASDLNFRCEDGYSTWNKVPENQWYFENDWEEWLANSTDPFDPAGGDFVSSGTLSGDSAVYPAGFRPYVLSRYSEPPICMMVPNSRDKKVEIMMESPMDNVNLCLNDAAYSGVGNNNVGAVSNCGKGKIYACFTAAAADSSENLGFFVDCKEGCEDMDIDVWIRIRVSSRSWDQGKEGTDTDLEHWCEAERGTTLDPEDGFSEELNTTLYYTYPSDLLPDEPSEYPYHINQIFGRNAGSQTGPRIWLISAVVLVGFVISGEAYACLFA